MKTDQLKPHSKVYKIYHYTYGAEVEIWDVLTLPSPQ